ncbi:DUF1801 domain-containing protein [Maribacter litopenaei]|uniref:DUF1801 domain-containing protein n=1 Tax=Maribacter litopenaei TaxID=2976127 RepID=A0ABY5Y488_9FLAO|nr:DUF1801 domain-containing protein [Maribacter litopenaei]UWX53803.1 DUF1801 domain-containing protein [Maribacter litopenaei]
MPNMIKASNFEEYVAHFPFEIQEKLRILRKLVKETAPDAVEGISYGMPAFKLNGKPLVYFAAQKNHFGFYATPNTHEAFAEHLSKYKQGKGSVQFPFNEQLPLELIKRMVSYKVRELSN